MFKFIINIVRYSSRLYSILMNLYIFYLELFDPERSRKTA